MFLFLRSFMEFSNSIDSSSSNKSVCDGIVYGEHAKHSHMSVWLCHLIKQV